MPRITIDQREIDVPQGATLLEAARRLGIEIPTLCFLEGLRPSTSCLVCMVKIRDGNRERLAPACATLAAEGMQVESDTPEVHQVRRTALELLLSDHVGDCLAPCHFACPCHMDVPLMLRQIQGEHLGEAIATIKNDIALPAVLGRVCPKPCEKGCRRNAADGAVSVCQLKRYAADADLASASPYLPECHPDTGRRVAIVGGGPTGLSAAYYLRRLGHACTILDKEPQLGGRLRRETSPDELPRDLLDAEIAQILRLGVEVRLTTAVAPGSGGGPSLAELRQQFDAVLLACGPGIEPAACGLTAPDRAGATGQPADSRLIPVDKESFQTAIPGVFAAGNAIRARGLVVRSVADGKEAAQSIDRFLSLDPAARPSGREKPFSSRIGRLVEGEIDVFLAAAGTAPRLDGGKGIGSARGEAPTEPGGQVGPVPFSAAEAVEQAGRCLHCDCRALTTCKLRRYAAQYGADVNRFRGQRRVFRQLSQQSQVIYEPGKCIDCGLCIQIATQAGEPLGLTFVGRGFDVRIGVPFDRSLEEALTRVAAECVAACPTAALAFKVAQLVELTPAANGQPAR